MFWKLLWDLIPELVISHGLYCSMLPCVSVSLQLWSSVLNFFFPSLLFWLLQIPDFSSLLLFVLLLLGHGLSLVVVFWPVVLPHPLRVSWLPWHCWWAIDFFLSQKKGGRGLWSMSWGLYSFRLENKGYNSSAVTCVRSRILSPLILCHLLLHVRGEGTSLVCG